jgi:hypothetical protein
MNLNRLPEASLTESANGRGTIFFGRPASLWGPGSRFYVGGASSSSFTPSLDPSPQFITSENARSVFELIQQRANKIDA